MITFIDHIGRTLIGNLIEETDTQLVVENPVILNVSVNQQTKQLNVNSFPLFFGEFLSKQDPKNIWRFNKSQIVVGDVTLESTLKQQYNSMVNPQPVQEPEVIKLFDD